MNHTPGPWKVSNHIDEEQFADIESVNDFLYIRANWAGPVRRADQPRMNAVMQANAYLIAAAPALLEAMQWIADHSNEPMIVRRADLLIAHAKGKP